jgi:hypothetical protein
LNSGTVDNDTVYEEIFTVFPNPVSQGEFYIKTNLTDLDGNINIFDIFGNAVNFKINKVNGKYRITINDNYPGIVFIRYTGNNLNKVVKVIIR